MMPHDTDCEEAVLAACFVYGTWRQQALSALSVDDFHDPRNGRIFDAITQVNEAGIGNHHWNEFRDEVMVQLGEAGLRGIGGLSYLDYIDRQTPVTALPYINVIAAAGERRRLMHLLERAALDIRDPDAKLGEVSAALSRDLETVQHEEFTAAQNVTTFLDENDGFDWLIPRLLEVGDRVMWTAGEGVGKSTLQLQLAVMVAAGLHPFQRYPIRALRVLYVDLENSPRQTRRALRGLESRVEKAGKGPGDLQLTPARPAGIDLRSSTDFTWLDRHCAKANPELIVIGPLYKCFRSHGRESKADETAAEECAFALDRLRERYGCALSLEAHAPHGSSGDREGLRPYGASLWLRWPEFGFGMKQIPNEKDVSVVPWRGPRDRDRDWPSQLFYGSEWPWEAGV